MSGGGFFVATGCHESATHHAPDTGFLDRSPRPALAAGCARFVYAGDSLLADMAGGGRGMHAGAGACPGGPLARPLAVGTAGDRRSVHWVVRTLAVVSWSGADLDLGADAPVATRAGRRALVVLQGRCLVDGRVGGPGHGPVASDSGGCPRSAGAGAAGPGDPAGLPLRAAVRAGMAAGADRTPDAWLPQAHWPAGLPHPGPCRGHDAGAQLRACGARHAGDAVPGV